MKLRLIGLALVMLSAGCPPRARITNEPPYFGPTVSLAEVVQNVDANNASIVSLNSDQRFWAHIHDNKHKLHKFDGEGPLLYRKEKQKPDQLYLSGEVLGNRVFEIGSTTGEDAVYWFAMMPPNEEGKEWWGHYKNLGKDCLTEKLPIEPSMLTEVLGVTDIPTNFLQQPVPVMRFNNDAGGAYMLTWNVAMGDRWICTKEVWFRRDNFLPTKVLLFDANGRIQIRAHLFNHEKIEGTDGKQIATRYDLFFPETQDSLTIQLQGPKLQLNGIPGEKTIRRRHLPDVQEVQVDENCP